MVTESWFHSLWRIPWKHEANSEKLVIGVLAFEIARLMSKVVNLWQSLSDKQISRLRENIYNSDGIKNLISHDGLFIERLVCVEILENMAHVAESVARLGKKCSDPNLKGFENAFNEFIAMGVDPYGWEFTGKKMEKKIKRMERFKSTTVSLYQEMEQSLTRLKTSGESSVLDLIEYEKKVARKTQEVNHLKDISLWNRTYDYTVHLLARSLFTIYRRISLVFGTQEIVDVVYQKRKEIVDVGGIDNLSVYSDFIYRRQSVSALFQSSSHPPENNLARFSSGPLNSIAASARSGPIVRTNRTSISHSGPLGDSSTKSGPILGKHANAKEFSSNPLGPGKVVHHTQSVFKSLCKLLNPPPETLGSAALALHYANIIILIEKLAASPHLIGLDARKDLYIMLPRSVTAALRRKLKPFTKTLASSSGYDLSLVEEWTEEISSILEWLAPLAHHMIRWQSERSFEQQSYVSRTNMLLVQTLYFANQEKTEEVITELLVGLNYVCNYGRALNAKAQAECGSFRVDNEYPNLNS